MPRFEREIVTVAEDIDELGHVNNLVYLRWIQDIARAHSLHVGWDHPAYLRINGMWVMRKLQVDFIHPTLVGEHISASTWVHEWSGASCVRKTRMARVSDGKELLLADTVWVFVNSNGRPRRIPPEVRRSFE